MIIRPFALSIEYEVARMRSRMARAAVRYSARVCVIGVVLTAAAFVPRPVVAGPPDGRWTLAGDLLGPSVRRPAYLTGEPVETSGLVEPGADGMNPYWLGAGLAVLGGAALFADEAVQGFVQDKLRGDVSNGIADFGRPFGDSMVLLSLMGSGYLAGLAMDDRRVSNTAFTALQSFAIAATMTEGIKRLAHRDRPNATDDAFSFNGPTSDSTSKSFISGHATHAFSVATVVALEYRDDPYIPVAAYGLATLTAASRVNDNRHWLSDVILGSTMGFVVGNLVHEFGLFNQTGLGFTVMPVVESGLTGLMIRIKF